jgi:hypothetical protein
MSNRFQAAWRVLRGKATVYRVSIAQLENAIQLSAWKDTPHKICCYDCWWDFASVDSEFAFVLGKSS